MNKQLINVVSQRPCKCVQTSELNFFHEHTMYTTMNFLGKHMILKQLRPNLPKVILKHIFVQITFAARERTTGEFQKDAPMKEMLVLNRSSLDRDWATDRQTGWGGGGGVQTDRQRRVQQELPLIYLRRTKIKRMLPLISKRPTKQTQVAAGK